MADQTRGRLAPTIASEGGFACAREARRYPQPKPGTGSTNVPAAMPEPATPSASGCAAIDYTALPDLDHRDGARSVVDRANDAERSLANALAALRPGKLLTARWPWFEGERGRSCRGKNARRKVPAGRRTRPAGPVLSRGGTLTGGSQVA